MGLGYSFSGAIEVLIGRVQRIGKVLLLAVLVAVGLTLLLFLLERYVIGATVVFQTARIVGNTRDRFAVGIGRHAQVERVVGPDTRNSPEIRPLGALAKEVSGRAG